MGLKSNKYFKDSGLAGTEGSGLKPFISYTTTGTISLPHSAKNKPALRIKTEPVTARALSNGILYEYVSAFVYICTLYWSKNQTYFVTPATTKEQVRLSYGDSDYFWQDFTCCVSVVFQ